MKDKKLSIRISEADWQRFHEKAEQADMTLTEYITDCCLGKQIVIIDGLGLLTFRKFHDCHNYHRFRLRMSDSRELTEV